MACCADIHRPCVETIHSSPHTTLAAPNIIHTLDDSSYSGQWHAAHVHMVSEITTEVYDIIISLCLISVKIRMICLQRDGAHKSDRGVIVMQIVKVDNLSTTHT